MSEAVAIPSASTSASGIVTADKQRFRGTKIFEYPAMSANNASYAGYLYYNNAETKVGEHWYSFSNDATNITKGQFYWRQLSPNSTANTSTTGHYETYSLPPVAIGLTANKEYEIFTSKNYTTLDSRYVNASGDDAISGSLKINTNKRGYYLTDGANN
jgi:hypothetical protein